MAFALHVENCSDPAGLIARFTFGTAGDAEAGHPEWFSLPAGGPPNVALELGTKERRNISPGIPIDLSALGTGDRYDFHVRLRETRATVRGGTFSRPIRVEVEYL